MLPHFKIIGNPLTQDEELRHYKALDRIKSIMAGLEEAMINMPSSWREFDDGYKPPTPDEIKSTFQPHSESKVAEMVGEPDTKKVEKWMNGDVEIPYSSWRMFLIITGRVFS